MPTITDQAIVIRRWDFSETSQTVSLFTREHGIIRGLAKGSKREKGDFSGGIDLLTRGEMVAIVKSGRDLATITAWHLQDMYRALREDLAANRMGLYMADLVHHMVIDHDPHAAIFDALADALTAMADPAAREASLLKMQWRLLLEAGYLPHLDVDARTGESVTTTSSALAFSASAGGVIVIRNNEPLPPDHWRVRGETINVLRRVAKGSLDSDVTDDAFRRANRLLAAYCREIVGHDFPAMRWAYGDPATRT